MATSFSLLSMLYIQAAQSHMKNQTDTPNSKKLSSMYKERRKLTTTSLGIADTVTVDAQTSEVKICRICGNDYDGNISIFDNTGDRNIVEDIMTIASVKIEENDSLPNHICAACLDLLNKALLFKRSCEKKDMELRKKLKRVEQAPLIDEARIMDEVRITNEPQIKDEARITKETRAIEEAPIREQESLDQNDDELLEDRSFDYDFDPSFSLFFADENTHNLHESFADTIKYRNGFIDCLICSRSFMDNDEYEEHISKCYSLFEDELRISEEIPYLCDFCGKPFKSKQILRRHRMVHLDELPFECDLCPYRGRDKQGLKHHRRTHTGERPYKCPHCPRTFLGRGNRNRHLTVHETQPRFKCSICHKGISTKRALLDHERSVHFGVKAYECTICGLNLSTTKNLLRHRHRIHKVKKALQPRRSAAYVLIDQRREEAKQR